MSWSLFKTKCMVLVGGTHISIPQFAQTIADAYHQAVSLHFDSMTAGGRIINNSPKFPILYQQILQQCQANNTQNNQIQFIQQLKPMIENYFVGLTILGPTGTVIITYPGNFIGLPITQNNNFNIMLDAMVMSFRTHIMTITGIYTSSIIPGVTSPWSGALLQSLP